MQVLRTQLAASQQARESAPEAVLAQKLEEARGSATRADQVPELLRSLRIC